MHGSCWTGRVGLASLLAFSIPYFRRVLLAARPTRPAISRSAVEGSGIGLNSATKMSSHAVSGLALVLSGRKTSCLIAVIEGEIAAHDPGPTSVAILAQAILAQAILAQGNNHLVRPVRTWPTGAGFGEGSFWVH